MTPVVANICKDEIIHIFHFYDLDMTVPDRVAYIFDFLGYRPSQRWVTIHKYITKMGDIYYYAFDDNTPYVPIYNPGGERVVKYEAPFVPDVPLTLRPISMVIPNYSQFRQDLMTGAYIHRIVPFESESLEKLAELARVELNGFDPRKSRELPSIGRLPVRDLYKHLK